MKILPTHTNNHVSPQIMGVVNLTADSFYDGGVCIGLDAALVQIERFIAEGVDILDLGAESTRPGAQKVDVATQLWRLEPVVKAILHHKIPLSIDTSEPEVMRVMLDMGAYMINDIRALSYPGAIEVVRDYQAKVCIMHMQNQPENMQDAPKYNDVLQEVYNFLQERISECCANGIVPENIYVDPGFGFGKSLEHNLTLLANLDFFKQLGCPITIGLSRKAMFGAITNKPVGERLHASTCAHVIAALSGANIIRVHDVAAAKDAMMVLDSLAPYWSQRRELVHG